MNVCVSFPLINSLQYAQRYLNLDISDSIDTTTNRRFSREDWKDFVERLEDIKKRQAQYNTEIITK